MYSCVFSFPKLRLHFAIALVIFSTVYDLQHSAVVKRCASQSLPFSLFLLDLLPKSSTYRGFCQILLHGHLCSGYCSFGVGKRKHTCTLIGMLSHDYLMTVRYVSVLLCHFLETVSKLELCNAIDPHVSAASSWWAQIHTLVPAFYMGAWGF